MAIRQTRKYPAGRWTFTGHRFSGQHTQAPRNHEIVGQSLRGGASTRSDFSAEDDKAEGRNGDGDAAVVGELRGGGSGHDAIRLLPGVGRFRVGTAQDVYAENLDGLRVGEINAE